MPPIPNMSTEKLDAYRKFYSEYVSELVNLHNYHLRFLNHQGRDSKRLVRVTITKIIRLERKLAILCHEAYNEFRENTKAHRAKLKELRAKAKPRVMPVHKGKKEKNNV